MVTHFSQLKVDTIYIQNSTGKPYILRILDEVRKYPGIKGEEQISAIVERNHAKANEMLDRALFYQIYPGQTQEKEIQELPLEIKVSKGIGRNHIGKRGMNQAEHKDYNGYKFREEGKIRTITVN